MIAVGSKTRSQPPPPWVVFEALVQPNRDPARGWLVLEDDEVAPAVLEAVEPLLVVWSSLWPSRPDAQIRFDLVGDHGGTVLRWTLLVDEPAPEDTLTGHLRRRIQVLINAELRFSFGAVSDGVDDWLHAVASRGLASKILRGRGRPGRTRISSASV